jgi:hypothetical protein
MSDEKQLDEIQQRTQAGLTAPIPHYYCNGFTNSLTNSDIVMLLEQNGIALATINLSFTTAKTISTKLGALVASLESISGRQILTSDELVKMTPKLIEAAKDTS